MYDLKIHHLAIKDIGSTIQWYEKQKVGLGQKFFKSFEEVIEFIIKEPFSYRLRYQEIRVCKAGKKFPHFIHYKIEEKSNLIIILGVYHGKQDPGKWTKRLR